MGFNGKERSDFIMKPKIMDEYTNNERENLIMRAVIKSLTDLGGVAKRKEVKRDIYDNSPIIPEDYIDYTRQSKQTGKEYKPFDYQFNFAIKHLLLADIVRYPKRGEVELTEKGRKVNLESFNPLTEVRVISEVAMEEESRKKKRKKEITETTEPEIEEEVWIGYTELDRKDKVCILKETHWRNLSCQRAERDAVTQMNLNIKS